MSRRKIGRAAPAAVALTFVLSLLVPEAAWPDQPGSEPSTAAADSAARKAVSIRPHFQFGFFGRMAERDVRVPKADFLMTWDLSFLRWDGSRATWGVGAHAAADDDGARLGFKGLWRTPLAAGGKMYLQLAPGIYVTATDNYGELRLPAWFLEAEVGFTNFLALAGGLEVLPYKGLRTDWREWERVEKTTSVGGYLGVKAGQIPGLAVMVGLFVAAAIALSASGPYM